MSKMVRNMWMNNLRDFEQKCAEMGYIKITVEAGERELKILNPRAYNQSLQSFYKEFGQCPQ